MAGLAGRRAAHVRGGRAGAGSPDRVSASGSSRRTSRAAEFYAEQLRTPDARIAREFLAQRGFDAAAAGAYGCGFAPVGWDPLTKHLRKQGFTSEELVAAGLAKEARSGSLIDRFRRRLLWPIRDLSGDVIGFGARRLFDDDDGPKYLNTPETAIYKKSQVLYGLDLAKRDIAKDHRAVVVEGYTDVMACHLAGVTTAVATCGTAFGSEHIGVLRRLLMDQDEFRGEVIFTFDGDEAGQKAALKAFEDDQRFVAQTFIAVSPGGMDPCELRLAQRRRGGPRPGRTGGSRSSRSRCAACCAGTTWTPPRVGWPRCGRPRRWSRRSRTARCAPSTPASSPVTWAWRSSPCCAPSRPPSPRRPRPPVTAARPPARRAAAGPQA